MKVIIPCAGKSSRYPNMKPKFLLTCPSGKLMVEEVIERLGFDGDIIITVLEEHYKKFELKKIFNNLCVIKSSNSQAETVYKTLVDMDISEPFLVKDSDSLFSVINIEELYNYVCVDYISAHRGIDVFNKSYVVGNPIEKIVEKEIISDVFSIGGYYFISPHMFMNAFENTHGVKEIYISHIIKYLMDKNVGFLTKHGYNYVDLGTIKEWFAWKKKFKTYFIDIDGVIVKSSSKYFSPLWGSSEGIKENIELINKLFDRGSEIILTTTRNEEYRDITIAQLNKCGLRYNRIIMGLQHSPRVIINDFSHTNPYPVSEAINIPRDGNINDFMREL